MRSLAAALQRCVPPAEVIQLDAGYLVVRRRHSPAQGTHAQQRPCAPKHTRRQCADTAFQRQVAHLRLLAHARLAVPGERLPPQGGPEARFLAALAAAAVARRALALATRRALSWTHMAAGSALAELD